MCPVSHAGCIKAKKRKRLADKAGSSQDEFSGAKRTKLGEDEAEPNAAEDGGANGVARDKKRKREDAGLPEDDGDSSDEDDSFRPLEINAAGVTITSDRIWMKGSGSQSWMQDHNDAHESEVALELHLAERSHRAAQAGQWTKLLLTGPSILPITELFCFMG